MVTIGDSFSVVATLAGIAVTVASFTITCALLFPAKVDAARSEISLHSGRSFGMGLVAFLGGVFSLIVLNMPLPALKLVGLMGLAAYFGLVAIGSAGVAKLCSERIMSLSDGKATPFSSFIQATSYIVIAGMLPILGWFLFAPLLMLVSGGAGLKAVLRKETAVSYISQ
jgi:hypothetical protein